MNRDGQDGGRRIRNSVFSCLFCDLLNFGKAMMKDSLGVIPCNLDEVQRSQLMASRVAFGSKQGLTP